MKCRSHTSRRLLVPIAATVLALALIAVQPPGLGWSGFVAWAQGVCGIAGLGDSPGEDGFQIDGQFYSGPDADDWAQGGSYAGVILDDGTPNPLYMPSLHDRDPHCAGGAKDPTIFSESNKNNDPIQAAGTDSVWHFANGDTPQKNDLTDVYAHSRTFEAGGETEVWLMLGALTRAANGDSHIDFEWNFAGLEMVTYPTLANDGEIFGHGPDLGRTAGLDFIISVDFEVGGTTPSVTIRRWTETAPGVFEYIEFDPGAGNVFVCTDVVGATVPPWGAVDPGGNTIYPPATATPLQFVEMGVDLTAFGIDPFDLCSATSTLLFKTRSSQSFTAELKDFALYPFPLVQVPECSIDDPIEVCEDEFPGGGITINSTVTPPGGSYAFEWYLDDVLQAETGSSFTLPPQTPGVYEICLVVEDTQTNCRGPECCTTVTVFETPDCSLSDPGDFCQDVFVQAVITSTPSGGTGPYSYEWWVNSVLQGETGSQLTVTDNSVGLYLIESRVTDSEGCDGEMCSVEYEIFEDPTCSLSDPGDFCQDDFTQAVITSTPSGGAGPYTYEWWVDSVLQGETGSQLTLTDDTVGSYFVESRVTDSNGCDSDLCDVTYEIFENPTCSLSDPGDFCQDEFVSASITNTPTGGTGPYTYAWWVNGVPQAETGATLTVSDNSAGTYLIESRTADGHCVSDICEVSYEIFENPACSLSDPGDFCEDDFTQAVITSTPTGGTGPYTYEWWVDSVLQGETGSQLTLTDDTVGSYFVESRVTDANNCVSEICDVAYEIFANPDCSLSDPGDFCEDDFTQAVITSTPTGGTGPYTYEWWVDSVLQGETGSQLTLTDDTVGSYFVESRVTDVNNCVSEICDTSFEIFANPDCSLSDPGDFCQDSFTQAVITSTPTGGTGPYTYEWWVDSVLQGETGSQLTLTDDTIGSYFVESRVTDVNNCVSEICDVTFEIVDNPTCSLSDPGDFCEDDFTQAVITNTPSGGTAPFTYEWWVDSVLQAETGNQLTVTDDTVGSYFIESRVTDAEDCVSSICDVTYEIFANPDCSLSDPGDFCEDVFVQAVITSTPTGGTGPYTYEWWVDSVLQGETGSQLTLTDDTVGSYFVESRVTDVNNCASEICDTSFEIFANPDCSLSDPGDFCQDSFTQAVITSTPTGGTGPYTYEWWVDSVLQGETGNQLTLTDDTIGSYFVESRVTDVNNCVSEICDVTFEIVDNPTCSLSDPGDFCEDVFVQAVITSTPSGGTAPFTYEWWVDSVLQAETGSQLTLTDDTVGSYFVESRVTDVNNCVSEICDVTFEIYENPDCSLSDPGDFCQDDFTQAVITSTPSGGTAPFTYEWWVDSVLQAETGSQLTLTDDTVGSYFVESRVTDVNNCVSEICDVTFEIYENPPCEITGPDYACESALPETLCGPEAPTGESYSYQWVGPDAPASSKGKVDGTGSNGVSRARDWPNERCIVITEEGRYYLTVVDDATDCPSAQCYHDFDVIEDPSCEVYAPEPLPSCGTDGHELCATEDNPGYTYSWEIVTAPAGWELVSPLDEYCVTYNTGAVGEATFKLTVRDATYPECMGYCEVSFECQPADEFCSFTQGYYGNAGGTWNGMGTLEIIQGLITPADPLVVGVWGTRAIKFEDGSEQCIIDRLPGGGPDAPLPDFGSQVFSPSTCQTTPPIPLKKGRISNNLLAQTIALSLNVRLGDDGDLAALGICHVMTTQAALCGNDGICGTSDDVPDPGPDGVPGTGDEDIMTREIPMAVLQALDNLGLGRTVGGLLELANRALAGMDTDAAGISEVKDAADHINNLFDECRFLIACTDTPIEEGAEAEFADETGFGEAGVPFAFSLSANVPNPVREGTTIRFALPEASHVKIAVYNLRGQVVSVIEDGEVPAGYHTAHWHSGGHARAAGVYFYRMEAVGTESGRTFSHTQKMVVVR